jgi:hypothetical protein
MGEQFTKTGSYGDKFYYKDPGMTIIHRADGPAIEWVGGNKSWYVNDRLHRLDGPAVEHVRGDKTWYVNGVFMFETNRSGDIIRRME